MLKQVIHKQNIACSKWYLLLVLQFFYGLKKIFGRKTNLITGVIKNGEEHGGRVDEGFGVDAAVDGKQDGRQKSKVAQD